MSGFGSKITELRKDKKISQAELAKLLSTSTSVIGRYERDEMTPSIEAAKKLAKILDTTVGYLLGESEQTDLFKDPEMFKRFKDILSFPKQKQEHIFFAIDSMIKATKLENI